eukprot:TRINITY_DN48152_c0_g1_i1.p2 TRINITY_DN48152_c0_g1~~TRINITY_DN48152_c0_g1_i1.p2  ORF type:complete len:108 (+),score=6.57 TRINITY_DN48152_c0_g1_i1:91-414(+)
MASQSAYQSYQPSAYAPSMAGDGALHAREFQDGLGPSPQEAGEEKPVVEYVCAEPRCRAFMRFFVADLASNAPSRLYCLACHGIAFWKPTPELLDVNLMNVRTVLTD